MENLLNFLRQEHGMEPLAEPRRCLTFAPLAWLKLQLFLHAGQTEVGGFGISSEADPLYIVDFATVAQTCTPVTVRFDDTAVADYFDACVDRGLNPSRFARLWIHTHPGDSPQPSHQDEETFARVFGSCDWAVMFILSRTGRTYARLSFGAGPGGTEILGTAVDWETWPAVILEQAETLTWQLCDWIAEYARHVRIAPPAIRRELDGFGTSATPCDGLDQRHEDHWIEERIIAAYEMNQWQGQEVAP